MKNLLRLKPPGSIRARLTLLFSFVFGITLALSSYFCFRLFTKSHQGEFDFYLYNHAVDFALALENHNRPVSEAMIEPPQQKKKRRLFSVDQTYSQICDERGNIIARSQNLYGEKRLPCSSDDFQRVQGVDSSYRTLELPERVGNSFVSKPYRMLTFPLPPRDGNHWILQLAAPLNILQNENAEILWVLLTLIPLTLGISAFLGYFGSRRAFSPVRQMTDQTARIEMTNLDERIQVKESDSELKELGRTLNQLLDRVEKAMTTQERFVADASHQLKTPLAILRGELDLLQARTDHSPETKVVLAEASQEVSQLIRMVENLLILARMDAGLDRLPFSPIRLDEILTETTNRLRALAQKKNVRLNVELNPFPNQPEATIDFECLGDADLFRCLLENLVENAIKYSAEGAVVQVRLKETAEGFTLEVQDNGKGMTPDEIQGVFERFRRDPKKALTVPGAGLGLAIAKKIADIHNGILSAEGASGKGSLFRLRLSKV